jgi:hypothetical protein
MYMGRARDVVKRFYECFGANDLDGALARFAPECVAVGLSGPLDNSAHHAAARTLKKALPDCHMELVRVLEMDAEIYFRVANEKIVEWKVVRDRLGMILQLGAVHAFQEPESAAVVARPRL